MGFFERSNLSFYFEDFGSGIPIIFGHGLGGSSQMARDLIGTVEDARVVLYDNRGHGRTSGSVDPSELTFSTMADDMAAILDLLGIESAVVGGDSMGAGISLAFWRRHKQKVRALILSRPAWLDTQYPSNLAILGRIAKLIDEFGPEEALKRFTLSDEFKQLAASYPQTAQSLVRSIKDSASANLALVYKRIPASIPFYSLAELGDIHVPTLIVGCPNDPIHPLDYAARLAIAIPGSRFHEIPSKNQSVEEHQRVFRRLVFEFMSGLKPEGLVAN